ncbi:MAG: helix-turn-helix domain-containing protein [Clostridia bacterium]
MYKIKIKLYRKQKALTLQELSMLTGISVGYLCHLENGTRKNPSIQMMEKISSALDIPISEIFFSK